ncbi:unnamed protein product [Brachionus calyciflorus]|uniref:Uncharacterized protein n=1 Tax=Brachionus calyciflorus TaxID=104777 RepID=A0A814G8Q2_9BILA|nr:unnamed protein product [Brachionus calyciflorus]
MNENALLCPYCYSELDTNPLILKCGLTVCSSHFDIDCQNDFDCILCKHFKPEINNGLNGHHKINLKSLFTNKSAQIKSFISKTNKLSEELDFYLGNLDKSEEISRFFINNYFDDLDDVFNSYKFKLADLIKIYFNDLTEEINFKKDFLLSTCRNKLTTQVQTDRLNDIVDEVKKEEYIERNVFLLNEKLTEAKAGINRVNLEINNKLASLLDNKFYYLSDSRLGQINLDLFFGNIESEIRNNTD